MANKKQWEPQLRFMKDNLGAVKGKLGGVGKAVMAGAAGAAMLLGNIGRSVADGASNLKDQALKKTEKSGEVITMKKSTVIALLVALAAVAGVLGALYVYVLRREKELDEYEQLLFSEDFNDDLLDDYEPDEAVDD